MISRLNKLIVLLTVVAICLYVVVLNREPATLRLAYDTPMQASVGIIVIITFILGFMFATLFGVFFGAKSYLRERKLAQRDKERQALYDGMIKARSAFAAGDLSRSQALWEQNIRREPKDIASKIELSKVLEAGGNNIEALKVIDQARSVDSSNVELLFRAAELNISLGNKTAAIDNLALSLSQSPSRKAALLARDLSEQLGRIEDAIEYHIQAERLGLDEIEADRGATRLELKRLLKENADQPTALSEKLRSFVKKHSDSLEALQALAKCELSAGDSESAAHYLVKAAKLDSSGNLWQEASNLWLKEASPERAISAARSAAREATGASAIDADIELSKLYLRFGMVDEARQILNKIPERARNSGATVTDSAQLRIKTLNSLCLLKLGKDSDAAEILSEVVGIKHRSDSVSATSMTSKNNGVSPALSTP